MWRHFIGEPVEITKDFDRLKLRSFMYLINLNSLSRRHANVNFPSYEQRFMEFVETVSRSFHREARGE